VAGEPAIIGLSLGGVLLIRDYIELGRLAFRVSVGRFG